MKQTTSKTVSFSQKIESEISHITKCSISARQAVIAGVFCTASIAEEGKPARSVKLGRDASDCIISFLRKENIEPVIDSSKREVKIEIPEECVEQFDLLFSVCFRESVSEILSANREFARSFLRGAFISCGYCSNPENAYRIELHLHNERIIDVVSQMLSAENIQFTIKSRKAVTVVTIQNGDHVSDFLGIIGASSSLLEFENIRAQHELLSGLTRTMNCDMGNAKRQSDAGAVRDELIMKLLASEKANSLPPQLREAAEIHIANPGASIAELGRMMNPPIGKSGMNHRLNKLIEIAKGLD